MLEKYFLPIFKRQKEKLPKVIASLEDLRKHRGLTQSVIVVLDRASHDLRNQSFVVSMVLEFEEIREDATVNP